MRIGVLWFFFFLFFWEDWQFLCTSVLTPFPSSLFILVEEGPPLFSFLNQFKIGGSEDV